jgi:hypothetical protein
MKQSAEAAADTASACALTLKTSGSIRGKRRGYRAPTSSIAA